MPFSVKMKKNIIAIQNISAPTKKDELVGSFISDDVRNERKKVKSLSHVWLCNPMNCCLPGSSVHGIFQARVLEWVAISFSRGSSRPRDQTCVFCTAGRLFTIWATREAHCVNLVPKSHTFIAQSDRNSTKKMRQLNSNVKFYIHAQLEVSVVK